MEWSCILVSLGGMAVIACLLFKAFFSKLGNNLADLATKEDLTKVEENVKHQFNTDIQNLKSRLERNNFVYQKIYEKKLDLLVELYQKLLFLYGYFCDWTAKIKPLPKDADIDIIETEQYQKVTDAMYEFKDFFLLNKIFFETELNQTIDHLFRDLWNKHFDYGYKSARVKDEHMDKDVRISFYKDLVAISDNIRDELPSKIEEIEGKIRNILRLTNNL